MEQRKCAVLVALSIAVMLFVPASRCEAVWYYLGSSVSSGPDANEGGDAWCGWEYQNSNPSRSADSSGVDAAADAWASSWVNVETTTADSNNQYTGSSVWGESYYFNTNVEHILYLDIDIEAEGEVEVGGMCYYCYAGDPNSMRAFSMAESGTDLGPDYHGKDGANLWGEAEEHEDGYVVEDMFGIAEGDPNESCGDSYYWGKIAYTVEYHPEDDVPYEGTQYTARAKVYTFSASSGSASTSSGVAAVYCVYADAWCDASCSIGVSQ